MPMPRKFVPYSFDQFEADTLPDVRDVLFASVPCVCPQWVYKRTIRDRGGRSTDHPFPWPKENECAH